VIESEYHRVISSFIFKLCFDSFHSFSKIDTIVKIKITLPTKIKVGLMSAVLKSSPIRSEIKFFILIVVLLFDDVKVIQFLNKKNFFNYFFNYFQSNKKGHQQNRHPFLSTKPINYENFIQ